MVEELPSGAAGEMFPVVVIPIGVGMVPNGPVVAGGDVAAAVVPGIDVEIVLCILGDNDAGTAVMGGEGSAGIAGSRGAGMVVPGKTVTDDVSGCWANVNGATIAFPVVGVEEVMATADVVDTVDIAGIAPVVPTIGDKKVTATAGVPGVI